MRRLLSALTVTLLLAINTLADDIGTLSVTEPPPADPSILVTILMIGIAIPNLLKSR